MGPDTFARSSRHPISVQGFGERRLQRPTVSVKVGWQSHFPHPVRDCEMAAWLASGVGRSAEISD
jgi:hypothetical protein